MKIPLKVLLIFDIPFNAPSDYDFSEEMKHEDWGAERKIFESLQENGYTVKTLGLYNDVIPLLETIKKYKPDIVFNSAEVFKEKAQFDKNIAGVLEMAGVPYTGASPASLTVCNNKALSKKILTFHKIKVPNFYTFYRRRKLKLVKRLKLPVIVKPLCEEASRGISQASIADSPEALWERIRFIFEKMNLDAIAEEYIEGREFYVSLIGNRRVRVLPLREITFGQMNGDEPRIATYKAKWDKQYRKKWNIKNKFAGPVAPELEKRIAAICRRAYHALNMQCYARLDLRVTPDNEIYIIEPNANPSLVPDDEVPLSAQKAGISYKTLVKKIVELGFQRI